MTETMHGKAKVNFDWARAKAAGKKKNEANLKDLQNTGVVKYIFDPYWELLLIGPNHDPAVMRAVRQGAKQLMHGTITIKKGELLSGPGELTVTGCKVNQAAFKNHIKAFSRKTVVFK